MAPSSSPSPSPRGPRRNTFVSRIPMLIAGASLMILGLLQLQGSLPPFLSYTQGQCMITDKSLADKFDGKRRFYAPVFEFTVQTTDEHMYQAIGYTAVPEFSSQTDSQAILDSYDFGQTYTCWYDPTNPTHAVLVRNLNPLGLGIFFIGLGIEVFFLWLRVKVYRAKKNQSF